MRFATVSDGGRSRVAAIVGDRAMLLDPQRSMRDVAGGDRSVPGPGAAAESVPLASITLGPAVPDPGAIYTVGANYRSPDEPAAARPERPLIFGKAPSSVGAPGR